MHQTAVGPQRIRRLALDAHAPLYAAVSRTASILVGELAVRVGLVAEERDEFLHLAGLNGDAARESALQGRLLAGVDHLLFDVACARDPGDEVKLGGLAPVVGGDLVLVDQVASLIFRHLVDQRIERLHLARSLLQHAKLERLRLRLRDLEQHEAVFAAELEVLEGLQGLVANGENGLRHRECAAVRSFVGDVKQSKERDGGERQFRRQRRKWTGSVRNHKKKPARKRGGQRGRQKEEEEEGTRKCCGLLFRCHPTHPACTVAHGSPPHADPAPCPRF